MTDKEKLIIELTNLGWSNLQIAHDPRIFMKGFALSRLKMDMIKRGLMPRGVGGRKKRKEK